MKEGFRAISRHFVRLALDTWWDWPLNWLTNHHPSVLWHCWLDRLTRQIVSEMTYSVSSGVLNPTIPHHLDTC